MLPYFNIYIFYFIKDYLTAESKMTKANNRAEKIISRGGEIKGDIKKGN